jgi:hypothetical protein
MLIFVFLLLLAIPVVSWLRRGLHRIPEGSIAVTERLGRFVRLAGPGLAWVTPGLEQISHTVLVRLREEQFTTRYLWFRDMVRVDIDFTISYWLDLHSVRPNLLREIAYYSLEQWHGIIESRAARVLQDVISRYNLMEVIGEDQLYRGEIERTFAQGLESELRELGFRLNQPKGVWLRCVELTQELQDALNNMRRTDIDIKTKSAIVDRILQNYPGLSDAALLSLLNMMGGEGKELIQVIPHLTGSTAPRGEAERERDKGEGEPPLSKARRGDSWRSLRPPPERSEPDHGE